MSTMDEHKACEVGRTTPISVAGRMIGNPLVAVISYLREHPGTVRHYDFIAGTSDKVTAELIKATRMPWMASRITVREEAWFIERARTAPWGKVAPDAALRDADAAQPEGLYDAASALWDHFWADRPNGIAVAKISKVLYLMRPAFFPILDRRLRSFYGPAAKTSARDVASRRPEFEDCNPSWATERHLLIFRGVDLRFSSLSWQNMRTNFLLQMGCPRSRERRGALTTTEVQVGLWLGASRLRHLRRPAH